MKIIYQDTDVLVVDKPCNIVVHPDAHHCQHTVLNLIKNKLNFSNFDDHQGIVHRLDKVVSGLMVVARHVQAWQILKAALKRRDIVRKYYALVKGVVKWNQLKVDVPLVKPGRNIRTKIAIIGKRAVTDFKVVKRGKDQTLLECQLNTGRTHQIRAHLQYIGHPIVNDPLYNQGNASCIFLYSYFLAFIHPRTKKELIFQQPLPSFFPQSLPTVGVLED